MKKEEEDKDFAENTLCVDGWPPPMKIAGLACHAVCSAICMIYQHGLILMPKGLWLRPALLSSRSILLGVPHNAQASRVTSRSRVKTTHPLHEERASFI